MDVLHIPQEIFYVIEGHILTALKCTQLSNLEPHKQVLYDTITEINCLLH
jgi:hypothetical protein